MRQASTITIPWPLSADWLTPAMAPIALIPLFILLFLTAPGSATPQESPDAIIQHRPARAVMNHVEIEARRQEQERLQQYLAKHSDDHETRIMLAEVMAERRFLNEAIRQLDKVLRADSTRVDVWRRRANWYRQLGLVRGEPDLLTRALHSYQAMSHFAAAAPVDAEDVRGVHARDLIAAAGLALALEETVVAADFARQIEAGEAAATVASLLLAAADYKAGRLEPAALVIDQIRATTSGPLIDVLTGFDLAGESDYPLTATGDSSVPTGGVVAGTAGGGSFGRIELACPGLAGPGASIATDNAAAVRLTGFWKLQDPTPTTPLNERYLDHCYRVMVADALFSRAGQPGRDTDRGRIFIRYGRPDQQTIDGANMSTEFTPRNSDVRPNESDGGMGRHVYGDPSMKLEFPRISWQYKVGKEIIGFQFEDLTLQGDFYYTNETAVQSQAVAKALPTLYERDVPAGRVQVAETRTRFRGRQADVIVSLAAAVPAVRLALDDVERDTWEEVEVRWVVFDSAYRTVAQAAMRLDDPKCAYRDAGGRLYLLAQADFDLPAGDYVTAVEFQDYLTGKEGMVKQEMTLAVIPGLLSEIELCREVRRAGPGSTRPFVRYDAMVVPNPRNEVATGDLLRFYYEVYRLGRTAAGNRQCRILHRVRSMNEPKDSRPVFPLAYALEIDEPVAEYDTYMPRVGQIDVSTLRVGRYELQVEVEDLVSGKSETRAIRFLRRP